MNSMNGIPVRRVSWWAGFGAGVAVGSYAALVGRGWYGYGRPRHPGEDQKDQLLDRFMPEYEVVERHHIRVAAPAAVTLAAAKDQKLFQIPLVRAIFKMRALVLGATADDRTRPTGLLAEVCSLGWGILAEEPDREVVVGGYTQPWEANVTFRALPPETFKSFDERGYVKIAWTLRADPISENESVFRTETRVVATDADARRRFRRYWAFFSPGIAFIRRLSLGPLKREAERRARS
jgi:hypothetical protein